MTVISIQNLGVEKNVEFIDDVSFFQDLNTSEVNATRGGFFPIVVIGAAWLGYSIVKEFKSKL